MALTTGQCAWIYSDNTNYFAIKFSGGSGGDTITSPNSTLAIGGTATNTTLDLEGSAGEIMAGATPALTYTPTLGKSGTAGTLAMFPASGNFTTTLGSSATASNTFVFPATVFTTGHLGYCATSSTTCTWTDAGYSYNALPLADHATQTANTLVANVTGSTAAPTAAAIPAGVQFYTAGTGYSAATAAQLGTVLNIASGLVLYSGGTAAAPVGSTDWSASATTLTAAAAGILNMGSATGTAALVVPSNTTNTASAAGVLDFDTTNKNYHGYVNGADSIFLNVAAAPTTNVVPKYVIASGNTLMGSSSLTDNGTTMSSSEPLVLGTANCTTFGTAGPLCAAEGTAPTNVSGTMALYPDSTAHEIKVATNGSASFGTLVRAQPGAVNQTSQTGSISTATLCAASAGACNVAGQYRINANFWGSGTACSVVTAGSVALTITWTDEDAQTHTAIGLPMWDETKGAMETSFYFNTALGTESAGGSWTISTNGTVIQYATTYSACTTGTGTYNLRLTAERLQ